MSAAIQPITGADAQTGGASVNDEGTAQRDRAPRRPSKLLTKDGSASYFEGEEAEAGAQDWYTTLATCFKGSDLVVAIVGLFGAFALGARAGALLLACAVAGSLAQWRLAILLVVVHAGGAAHAQAKAGRVHNPTRPPRSHAHERALTESPPRSLSSFPPARARACRVQCCRC